jgi:RND family efflux transporter MFP subunit
VHRPRLFAFGLLLTAAACQKEKIPAAAIETVRAGTVEQIVPDIADRYSASISPLAQIDLTFKSPGLVDRILQVRGADGRTRNVQAGDQVTKGAELAAVRAVDFEQRVQQAQAQVDQAEAQLAQAQANLRASETEFTRDKILFDSASLLKPQFDQAKGRYEADQAAVQAALAAAGNARTVVGETKLSLSDTALYAPFTGWISARNVETGSLAASGTVAFSMIDTHLVKAIFAVPDIALKSVRLGQKQAVALDAVPNPVQGVVTSISPQADPKGRVFSIEVTLPNSGERVRPGMIGSLTLGPARNPSPRLVIPLGAVVRSPSNAQGFAVFQLSDRDGKTYAAAREIQIGQTYGNSIEVVSGLKQGERIVAVGGSLLRDGQEVRVLP